MGSVSGRHAITPLAIRLLLGGSKMPRLHFEKCSFRIVHFRHNYIVLSCHIKMHIKKIALLLFALLIFVDVAAIEAFDPRTASYIELDYAEFGNITVIPKDDLLPYLKLNLFSFPRETETLRVFDLKTNPISILEEKEGEKSYLFSWKNLKSGTYDYRLEASIKNSQQFPKVYKKINFPFYVPDEIKQYTQATKKTESDDFEIKETANKLAAGETDAYKLIFKIANFVHEQITYDEAYWQDVWSAKEVLQTKRGVCDEFTNLFIALVRSLGIPARYIVGSVYTNIPTVNDFQYHAWAEVWFPDIGWVPFDPTFAEYGWIDPTHIIVRHSKIVEPVSISYSWQNGNVIASNLESKIKIISKTHDLPNYINAEVWLQEDKVKIGSYNILWMRLENTQDFYIHVASWLSKAPNIEGKNQHEILLGPKEKTTVGWILKTPSDLDENYIYTYTIEAQTLFSQNKSIKLEVNPKSSNYISLKTAESKLAELTAAKEVKGEPKISVEISHPKEAFVTYPILITAKIKNSGTAPADMFRICLNEKCKNLYIGINDYVEQNFTVIENDIILHKYTVSYEDQKQEIEILVKKKTLLILLREFFNKLFSLQ